MTLASPILLKAYRDSLRRLHAEQQITMSAVNAALRGKTVVLKAGRFKHCRAIVLDYYFDAGNEYLHVRVISGGKTDVVELDDCEML